VTRRPIDPRVGSRAHDGAAAADTAAADALRAAFSHWATGVAVVTARDDDGHVYAMTVAALTPVSVEPPLVLTCIHNDAPLASVLVPGMRCAISILGEGQKRAATTFADRFAVPGGLLIDEDAAPVVADAAATLIGRVGDVHDGGDHRIVVVRVERVRVDDDAKPLLYWQREYRRLQPES